MLEVHYLNLIENNIYYIKENNIFNPLKSKKYKGIFKGFFELERPYYRVVFSNLDGEDRILYISDCVFYKSRIAEIEKRIYKDIINNKVKDPYFYYNYEYI